ncbi:MAG TPA: hypothetical protein VIJ94_07890 [Caulobacteraceae bacterium]
MHKTLTGAVVALTIVGALAAAASASADPHDRGGRGRGHGDGAAVAAGIAGLAIGAAIAGDHPGYSRNYYYGGPPPGYYDGPAYYTYYGNCHSQWRWSRHSHRYVRVRGCY